MLIIPKTSRGAAHFGRTDSTPVSSGSLRRSLRRRAQAGFTIVEVMMAVIIMAFAITTSITTLQRGFLALDTARNLTIAGQIMQSELEKMRLLPWATIDAYPASATAVPYDPLHPEYFNIDRAFTTNSSIGNRFTLVRTSTAVTSTMKLITMTVTWTSYDGRQITRSYSTYYGQNGLYDYFYNSL